MDWEPKLLSEIDTGVLRLRTHNVVRRLADHQNAGELGKEVVTAFDQGMATGNERLLEMLWERIETLPLAKQGSLRTLVALLLPDEPMDSHLAEYLIGWAQDDDVPPNLIEAAFR